MELAYVLCIKLGDNVDKTLVILAFLEIAKLIHRGNLSELEIAPNFFYGPTADEFFFLSNPVYKLD